MVRVFASVRSSPKLDGADFCCISSTSDSVTVESIGCGESRNYSGFHSVLMGPGRRDELYSAVGQPLVKRVVSGLDSALIAYGQTASGKSYSMGMDHISLYQNSQASGSVVENSGLVPRSVQELFAHVRDVLSTGTAYAEIALSFIEVYREKVYDLLSTDRVSSPLRLAESAASTGPVVLGLTEHVCRTYDDAMKLLATGITRRATAATLMNSASSRSHAIITAVLRQSASHTSDEAMEVSRMHFVDLAGSERVKRSDSSGDRLKEGSAINAGLLALGNVISSLKKGACGTFHVAYRQSKLTRILKSAFRVECSTHLLVCLSPSPDDISESIHSLEFASRAMTIGKGTFLTTESSSDAGSESREASLKRELATLRRYATKLEEELSRFRARYGEAMTTRGTDDAMTPSISGQRDSEIDGLQSETEGLSSVSESDGFVSSAQSPSADTRHSGISTAAAKSRIDPAAKSVPAGSCSNASSGCEPDTPSELSFGTQSEASELLAAKAELQASVSMCHALDRMESFLHGNHQNLKHVDQSLKPADEQSLKHVDQSLKNVEGGSEFALLKLNCSRSHDPAAVTSSCNSSSGGTPRSCSTSNALQPLGTPRRSSSNQAVSGFSSPGRLSSESPRMRYSMPTAGSASQSSLRSLLTRMASSKQQWDQKRRVLEAHISRLQMQNANLCAAQRSLSRESQRSVQSHARQVSSMSSEHQKEMKLVKSELRRKDALISTLRRRNEALRSCLKPRSSRRPIPEPTAPSLERSRSVRKPPGDLPATCRNIAPRRHPPVPTAIEASRAQCAILAELNIGKYTTQ